MTTTGDLRRAIEIATRLETYSGGNVPVPTVVLGALLDVYEAATEWNEATNDRAKEALEGPLMLAVQTAAYAVEVRNG